MDAATSLGGLNITTAVIYSSAVFMASSSISNYKFLKNLNLVSGLSLPIIPLLTAHDLRALNFLYRRVGKFIQQNSRRYSVLVVPQIRRRLRLALFLGLLRAYFIWWKQVLFDPKSWFEKMVKRGSISSIWFLLAALRGKAFARPQPVAQAPAAPAAPACSPLEMVIARGTTEPKVPLYGLVVGDPLFEAVQKLIPEVTAYSVNYPASFESTSRNLGRDDVVKHLNEQSKKCPNQKYVLVGYSQGADVMHNAAAKLDPSIYPKINSMVMFGDPGNKGPQAKSPLNCDPEPVFPPALSQKLKENCEKGDPVCTNDGTVPDAHLVYSDPAKGYIKASSEYIQQQYKTGSKVGPQPSPNVGVGDNNAALLELGKILGSGASGTEGCGLQNAKGGTPAKGPVVLRSMAPVAGSFAEALEF